MAGPTKRTRLNSPLMYAFRSAHEARDGKKTAEQRDEANERVVQSRRSAARVPITELVLRQEVARDLHGLMNTVSLDSSFNLEGFDRVRSSILNYGFPDIAHRTIDELSLGDVRGEIAAVLTNYEPRLVAETIHVTRDASLDPADLKIRFIIRADLLCEPLNVPVEFVADVELDSGKMLIGRL